MGLRLKTFRGGVVDINPSDTSLNLSIDLQAANGILAYADSATGGLFLPVGTTDQRPAIPVTGQTRYNSTISQPEYYNGTIWATALGVPIAYLVVAGGSSGSGAGDQSAGGAGGGAGGVLQGITNIIPGNIYTIYVGAGAPRTSQSYAQVGTQSFIQGPSPSNMPYILSYGGGIASGIGGATSTFVAGQGNPGGAGGGSGYPYPYPGGGGAGGAGGNSSMPNYPGSGGIGVVSSITGSAVYYGGGGGGGILIYNDSAGGGAGGAGGGGGGSSSDIFGGGGNGAAFTGGGGGGSAGAFGGGSGGGGGSGVIILSVPTGSYTGIVTGSPTVTINGANTVIKFTSSGTYKA